MGTPSPATSANLPKFAAIVVAIALLAFTAGLTLQPTTPWVLVLAGLTAIGWTLAVWNWIKLDELEDDLARIRASNLRRREQDHELAEKRRRTPLEPKRAVAA